MRCTVGGTAEMGKATVTVMDNSTGRCRLGGSRKPSSDPRGAAASRNAAASSRVVWDMFERFTDRARNVVVLAQQEARLLKHNYIGTEHILLGLARESDGLAAQVLVTLGGDLSAIRQQVIRLLKENPTTDEKPQAAQARVARLAESVGETGIASRAESAGPMGLASPAESASLNGKLNEVLSRLDSISNRMTLIERALGIGTVKDDD